MHRYRLTLRSNQASEYYAKDLAEAEKHAAAIQQRQGGKAICTILSLEAID